MLFGSPFFFTNFVIFLRGDDEYDYYSDEEEEAAPPMPEIPQQYLSGGENTSAEKPLFLGTSGARQNVKQETENVEPLGVSADKEGVPGSPSEEAVSADQGKGDNGKDSIGRKSPEQEPLQGRELVDEPTPKADVGDARFSYMPSPAQADHKKSHEQQDADADESIQGGSLPTHESVKRFEEYQGVAYPAGLAAEPGDDSLPEIDLPETVVVPESVEGSTGKDTKPVHAPEKEENETQVETEEAANRSESEGTDFNDFIDEYYGDDNDDEDNANNNDNYNTNTNDHADNSKDSNDVLAKDNEESVSTPVLEQKEHNVDDSSVTPTINKEIGNDEAAMPPPPSVIRRLDQTHDSVKSFAGETDSSASLSTGRRSPESSIHTDPRNSRHFEEVATGSKHQRNVSSSSNHNTTSSLADVTPKPENSEIPEKKDETAVESSSTSPPPVRGRWKPLPDTTPIVTVGTEHQSSENDAASAVKEQNPTSATPTGDPNQDKLTREILGSFGEGTKERPKSQHFDYKHVGSRESLDEAVDPEIMELYQNSSSFLTQTSHNHVDYSEKIEPLTTTKSRSPEAEEEEEQGYNYGEQEGSHGHTNEQPDVVVSPDVDTQQHEQDVVPVSDDEDDHHSFGSKESEDEEDDEIPKSHNKDVDDNVSIDSGVTSHSGSSKSALSDKIPTSEGQYEQNDSGYKTMILPEIPDDSAQVSKSGQRAGESPANRNVSGDQGLRKASNNIASRLNKPPTFDFSGILSKPRSADRKAAFDAARQKELEYDSGLANWLESVSSSHNGSGIYSSGKPPAPTENEAKMAAPSRTMSSVMRPAKSMVSSHVINRVGEKSSKKAKGLFAKGKKFMKTSQQPQSG